MTEDDEFAEPRFTRDCFLASIVGSSRAWGRELWSQSHGWQVPANGDSPASCAHDDAFGSYDRPIEQLMIDVLCLAMDTGRAWALWQSRVSEHLAALLDMHSLQALLRPLPTPERQQFEMDLAALGLVNPPSKLTPWQLPGDPGADDEWPTTEGPSGWAARPLFAALGQAMIEQHRARALPGGGWAAEDPEYSVAARAYDQVRRDAAPPLERLTLATCGLCLDTGRSSAHWQQRVWGHARDVLSNHDLGQLLVAAPPWYRTTLLHDLSHLGICPVHLDPRRQNNG